MPKTYDISIATLCQTWCTVSQGKNRGANHTNHILGIEIDSMSMSLQLPEGKLGDISNLIQSWLGKKEMHQKRALASHWKTFVCVKSDPIRKTISALPN